MNQGNLTHTAAKMLSQEGKFDERIFSEQLTKIAAFQDLSASERPNPFDDPYVACAILDDANRIIGFHRKTYAQSIHSEPEAIIDALKNANNPNLEKIAQKISAAYETKLWLRGTTRLIEFEGLFRDAGHALRQHLSIKDLRLYSTLEPCRLYETQPSCACIICATGFESVGYGADDHTLKGQGRDILQTGRSDDGRQITPNPPKTTTNLSFKDNLNVNALFYSAGQIISNLVRPSSSKNRPNSSDYCVLRLERDTFDIIHDKNSNRLYALLSNLSQSYFSSRADLHNLTSTTTQHVPPLTMKTPIAVGGDLSSSAIILNGQAAPFLSGIIADHARHNLPLPSHVVTTSVLSDPDLKTKLSNLGIQVFQNAFRRQEEEWLARRHIQLTALRTEYANHLHILLKYPAQQSSSLATDDLEPYGWFFGDMESLGVQLMSERRPPVRLTVFCSPQSYSTAVQLVVTLDEKNMFSSGKTLHMSSVQIRICHPDNLSNERLVSHNLIIPGTRQREMSRCQVVKDPEPIAVTPSEIAAMVTVEGMNPTSISSRLISDIAHSLSWRDRRNAGLLLTHIARQERQMLNHLVIDKLEAIIVGGIDQTNWTSVCTYMNSIEKLPRWNDIDLSRKISHVLSQLGKLIEDLLINESPAKWIVDVTWRWLACWTRYSNSISDFAQAFNGPLGLYICRDTFLTAQLIQYLFIERKQFAVVWLYKIRHQFSLDERLLDSVGITYARCAFACQVVFKSTPVIAFLQWLQRRRRNAYYAAMVEEERCGRVWENRLGSVENEIDPIRRGKLFATLINLRMMAARFADTHPDSGLVREGLSKADVWRLDASSPIDRVLEELAPSTVRDAITGMANDDDLATQWAALCYTIGPRSKTLAHSYELNSKRQRHELRDIRTILINQALARSGSHYWLQREIYDLYADAIIASREAENYRSTSIDSTWPQLSSIYGFNNLHFAPDEELHPELVSARARYRKNSKTVALVLPPISLDSTDNNSEFLSPPLGLGQIAAALSSDGHYVALLNYHNTKKTAKDIAAILCRFDIIGYSVVESTLSSTAMIDRIVYSLSTSTNQMTKPKTVIGGPAATLTPPRRIWEIISTLDFVVAGAGESAMRSIAQDGVLDHLDGRNQNDPTSAVWTTDTLSSASAKLAFNRGKAAKTYATQWNNLPWIDRRIFGRQPDGKPVEPGMTRSSTGREAHMVMSRGCDWSCGFCTEALTGGSFGEMRRTWEDVFQELRFLRQTERVSRFQFIDDNVFPTIAHLPSSSKGKMNASKFRWTSSFLGALEEENNRTETPITWRGLMRVEDYLSYRKWNSSFPHMLARSGCRLLAFGLESGNAETRRSMKGSSATSLSNVDVVSIINELEEVGIFSKGYFILGGENGQPKDIEETINFAIDSGLALAYFAIYKDFRIASTSRRPNGAMEFGLFHSRLDDLFSRARNETTEVLGNDISAPAVDEMFESYAKLREMGFSFRGLIKYNDYHLEVPQNSKSQILNDSKYFENISSAYARFYCRQEWIPVYESLLKNGF